MGMTESIPVVRGGDEEGVVAGQPNVFEFGHAGQEQVEQEGKQEDECNLTTEGFLDDARKDLIDWHSSIGDLQNGVEQGAEGGDGANTTPAPAPKIKKPRMDLMCR